MRMHVLQHVDFEHAAAIGDWARKQGHLCTSGGFYRGDPPPPPAEVEWLVVMGGPMGVGDEERHPWLVEEKRYLRAVLDTGARMLGVCLGAQLLAELLGAAVTRNPFKEIGWFPVTLSRQAREHEFFYGLPHQFTAFHWHGDTFALPPEAVPLGGSDACEMQGFLAQGRILGLQFHLESTVQSVDALIENCSDDITPGPYVQEPEAMRRGFAHLEGMHPLLETLLQRLETADTGE